MLYWYPRFEGTNTKPKIIITTTAVILGVTKRLTCNGNKSQRHRSREIYAVMHLVVFSKPSPRKYMVGVDKARASKGTSTGSIKGSPPQIEPSAPISERPNAKKLMLMDCEKPILR